MAGLFLGGPPAPLVPAALRLEGSSEFRAIEFLLDTGASGTVIHPRDAIVLWDEYLAHDFERDETRREARGVGGAAERIVRNARIAFVTADGERDEIQLAISVARLVAPNAALGQPGNLNLPSLLGRDVLNYYRVEVDGPALSVMLIRES